jgi:hypothetical protein
MSDKQYLHKTSFVRVVILVCVLITTSVSAQNTVGTLDKYFAQVRTGKYPAIPKSLSTTENSKATLAALPPYLIDTVAAVRAKAYAITQFAGNNARQAALRQDAVQKLMNGARDRNAGNAGIALNYLTGFQREDFTQPAKDTLTALLKRRAPQLDKIVRLVGYLELATTRDDLRAITQEPRASRADKWSATLALVRMGDSYAQENVMNRLRRMPVNDEVVYGIFPDLVYTRNKQFIDYLVGVLNSTDANCQSADAERPARIPCGYRVMEMLASVIADYPVKVDASGDVAADDYTAALQTVRDWFAKHPDYTILKDRY